MHLTSAVRLSLIPNNRLPSPLLLCFFLLPCWDRFVLCTVHIIPKQALYLMEVSSPLTLIRSFISFILITILLNSDPNLFICLLKYRYQIKTGFEYLIPPTLFFDVYCAFFYVFFFVLKLLFHMFLFSLSVFGKQFGHYFVTAFPW